MGIINIWNQRSTGEFSQVFTKDQEDIQENKFKYLDPLEHNSQTYYRYWKCKAKIDIFFSKKKKFDSIRIRDLNHSNRIRTHNHLVHKRTLNQTGQMIEVCWKNLLVPCTWRLFRARSSLTFRRTKECRFTLKHVQDMIITYNQHQVQVSLIRTRNSQRSVL